MKNIMLMKHAGRRRLRRLLSMLLWPRVSVRHYGFHPEMSY